MLRLRWVLALVIAGAFAPARAESNQVQFDDTTIEGEGQRPGLGYVGGRQRPTFRCDISRLTLAEYNACYEEVLSELCGTQVIERDRFELVFRGRTLARGGTSRTVASAHPYSLHLDRGQLLVHKASAYDVWSDPKVLLRDQSPQLSRIDSFVTTRSGFLLADTSARRLFVMGKTDDDRRAPRKIELGRGLSLVGVLSNGRFVVSSARGLLVMGADGRSGRRLELPADDYELAPHVDASGNLLLASPTAVNVVSPRGKVRGSFARKPGYAYHLLPSGVVASAELSSGTIALQTPTGVVLSRTKLERPLSQFGVLRQRRGADLYFVAADGIGVLYADGFEKSFLARKTTGLRVVEAENGVLGVVVSTPSKDDERQWVERTVEYYALGASRSRVSRVVEGVCPMAIKLAERALRLKPSLKASLVEGRFSRPR